MPTKPVPESPSMKPYSFTDQKTIHDSHPSKTKKPIHLPRLTGNLLSLPLSTNI